MVYEANSVMLTPLNGHNNQRFPHGAAVERSQQTTYPEGRHSNPAAEAIVLVLVIVVGTVVVEDTVLVTVTIVVNVGKARSAAITGTSPCGASSNFVDSNSGCVSRFSAIDEALTSIL